MAREANLTRYAWLSIAAAFATLALKWTAWWLTGSVGLLSDALEAFVNLGAALLALWMLRLAARPPDALHPHGRSKAEYFAAGAEGALIVLAAVAIIVNAAPRLVSPQPLDAPALGLGLTALATALNLAVALILLRAGKARSSITLEADGRHLLSDVWTSLGVVAGVALVWLSGWLVFDPLVALAVGAYIIWSGVHLVGRSIRGLLDAAIPADEEREIARLFAEYSASHGVLFHALRTRQAGARQFGTFHLLVPDEWTVQRAHQLSEEIEARIRGKLPNISLTTHIEPLSDPASYDDQALDR